MNFNIDSNKYTTLNLMRRLGYQIHGKGYVKRLSRNKFPRFHIYLKEKKDNLEISLHLDQKGACYEGQTAHSGEYDTDILEQEKERILKQLD